MTLQIDTRVKLNNGIEMPYFGLGLYLAGKGQDTINAVKWGYETGYRLFDTAQFYHNEAELGQAINELGIDQSEVFVTTKLWTSNFDYDKALETVNVSYKKLDLEYIDLFLLHYPVSGKRLEAWRALEKIYDEGMVKSIGVSNFTIKHLEELFENSEITPVVNQVEFHPWLYQKDLLNFCNDHDVILQAYSPLVKGERINNSEISEFAKKYDKTNAQILIRWGLEHGLSVIPKSNNRERIKENADLFDFSISEEDIERLNALDEHYHCTWDPCYEK
ncbi:MAG: aldo/keto reductase [Candidatus Kariarchaeaceae archaeon]|jgi:diketogulonate reductase-like aldo/keto reductase